MRGNTNHHSELSMQNCAEMGDFHIFNYNIPNLCRLLIRLILGDLAEGEWKPHRFVRYKHRFIPVTGSDVAARHRTTSDRRMHSGFEPEPSRKNDTVLT